MLRPTIVLFDVDGTLVSTGGAGGRSMNWAFGHLHARPDACASFSLGGMTDRAIARKGLQNIGILADDAAIDALLAAYLQRLETEMQAAKDARVLAGVHAAIALTQARSHTAVGLGTGNVRHGAEIKLGALGLMEHFAFGGFGCDHEDRGELLAAGARRGAQHLRIRLADCEVLVVGDTPKDVLAAEAMRASGIKVKCLAVATGPFALDALQQTAADWVVPNLEHPLALQVFRGEL